MLLLKKLLRLSNDSKGFSVVELLVAMVVILLMATVITPLLVFTAQSTQHNRAKATAKNIANEKIEEIRAMDFANLGVINGNPEGNIPSSDIVIVDGREYQVSIGINWVDHSGCFSADHAEWDVKMATVEVSSYGFYVDGNIDVTEKIESLISRDSEQPLFTGANIRCCVFRGWYYEMSDEENRDYQPVSGVNVTITDESNITTSGNTVTIGSRSFVLFLDIAEENYTVDVNPSGLNMIVKPGTYPLHDVAAVNDTTTQLFALVEYPGALDIVIKDENDYPIQLDNIEGTFTLLLPHGDSLSRNITGSDVTGNIIPDNLFNDLWPHQEKLGNYYTFTAIDIPGYLTLVNDNGDFRIWDVSNSEYWRGYFKGPGEKTDLIIYLWEIPEIDETETNGEAWLKGAENSTVINNDLDVEERVSQVDNILKPGIFNRDKLNNSYGLSTGSVNFYATEFYFKGDELDISNKANLLLHANYLRFENRISLSNNNSSIVLNTLKLEVHDDDYHKVVWPDTDEGKPDLECLVPVDGFKNTIVGSLINNDLPGPWNAVEYGVVYLEEDVSKGQSNNIIIPKGAYYFPDGFDFETDWDKNPEEGGLIVIAD